MLLWATACVGRLEALACMSTHVANLFGSVLNPCEEDRGPRLENLVHHFSHFLPAGRKRRWIPLKSFFAQKVL